VTLLQEGATGGVLEEMAEEMVEEMVEGMVEGMVVVHGQWARMAMHACTIPE
jgi:hypothetical protein